ncbi:MAG: hypothetical protein MZV70_17180 [Desulfobacterales bacterium]|nr:hypothetical protein [Desulfobacterales bacterium]
MVLAVRARAVPGARARRGRRSGRAARRRDRLLRHPRRRRRSAATSSSAARSRASAAGTSSGSRTRCGRRVDSPTSRCGPAPPPRPHPADPRDLTRAAPCKPRRGQRASDHAGTTTVNPSKPRKSSAL